MFASCSFNFWSYWLRGLCTQGISVSTIGQNKGSTELKVETVTWPFCAPYAPGLTGQKGGYCLAGDYQREIVLSKRNRNTATTLSERRICLEHKWSSGTLPNNDICCNKSQWKITATLYRNPSYRVPIWGHPHIGWPYMGWPKRQWDFN